jgi:hypothetical protein
MAVHAWPAGAGAGIAVIVKATARRSPTALKA